MSVTIMLFDFCMKKVLLCIYIMVLLHHINAYLLRGWGGGGFPLYLDLAPPKHQFTLKRAKT